MSKDKFGIALSIGCLIHCLFLPILMPVIPVFGLAAEHEAVIHLVLGVLVAITAAFTIGPGFIIHRDILTLALGVVGVSLIISAGIIELYNGGETLVTIVGSISLIAAHYNNHKLLCSCDHHKH